MSAHDLSVKAGQSVERLLGTLCDVVGFHIAELWINSDTMFCLSATYVDEAALSPYRDQVMTFQHGNEESKTSRSLCKRALLSKHSFYWLSLKSEKVHPIVPYHTAISFHLPRDNINSDVYVCAYSLDYIKFSQVRGLARLGLESPLLRASHPAPTHSPNWISYAG